MFQFYTKIASIDFYRFSCNIHFIFRLSDLILTKLELSNIGFSCSHPYQMIRIAHESFASIYSF